MDNYELECACCKAEVDLLAAFVAKSDELVAKALMVPEIAQIARAEVRLREYLLIAWRARARQAAKLAGEKRTESTVMAVVDRVMGNFKDDVSVRFKAEAAKIYKLARRAGWKKATGHSTASLSYSLQGIVKPEAVKKAKSDFSIEPVLGLKDEKALAELSKDQLLWLGTHYDQNVRSVVLETIKAELEKGYGRAEIGKKLEVAVRSTLKDFKVPGGFHGSDSAYFEGLAANVTTNARVRGQIASFSELEVVTYEIVNPMDERTSEICQWMNGKQFRVSDAEGIISRLAGTTDPEAYKQISPWLSFKQLKGISSGAGQQSLADSKALTSAGFILPPFHGLCRSTIDLVG